MPLASLEAAVSGLIGYFEELGLRGSAEAYFSTHPKRLQANLDMMRLLGLHEYLRWEEAAQGSGRS
jgi:hypothetical protein